MDEKDLLKDLIQQTANNLKDKAVYLSYLSKFTHEITLKNGEPSFKPSIQFNDIDRSKYDGIKSYSDFSDSISLLLEQIYESATLKGAPAERMWIAQKLGHDGYAGFEEIISAIDGEQPLHEDLDLDAFRTYAFLAEECWILALAYENFFKIRDVIENFCPDINQNLFRVLESLKENMLLKIGEVEGYWKAKHKSIKLSRAGTNARQINVDDRVKRLSIEVMKKAELSKDGIKIDTETWNELIAWVFEPASPPTYKTDRVYRSKVQEYISKDQGKGISLTIK
ncbi:hypothetical protein [uncultured Desulfosarcina sp.]|uniref:hypothetical protein n=1 Tax=uncultured Desulfosarcina sp. TaxID=218289 RepID=UPI0029C8931F|nr:hypothetical protein [uncultured Desulfosarcina sp.]